VTPSFLPSIQSTESSASGRHPAPSNPKILNRTPTPVASFASPVEPVVFLLPGSGDGAGTDGDGPTHFPKEEIMRRHYGWLAAGLVMIFIFAMAAPATAAEEPAKVNINTATVDELAQLQRIGPAYAARIVDYREQNGPFEKPEDILKVRGIGPKTWEANKDCLCVE
jgi:competence protein ComEA